VALPVPGAVVWIEQTGVYAETGRDGSYVIHFALEEKMALRIAVQMLGYDSYRSADFELKPGEARRMDVVLIPRTFDQPLVVIRPGVPDSVWGDARLAVVDFLHTNDGLVLLTGERTAHLRHLSESHRSRFYAKCHIIFLDNGGKETQRIPIPEDVERLHASCFGDVFIVGRNTVWWLTGDPDSPLESISRTMFEESVIPLVDTLEGQIIFSTFRPDFPEFEYRLYNVADTSSRRFRHIVNEPVMELFRSSFKYLDPVDKVEAFQYQLDHGVDKEIVAGFMSGFAQTNYFEPMNAPLFVSRGGLILFDHHHHKLVRFTSSGVPADSVAIRYHLIPQVKWGRQIIHDSMHGKFYTTVQKAGTSTLHEIDILTGHTVSVRKLHWPWVSKICVHDGEVYYLWRPFESAQRTWLYKERLGG